jgi:FAD/FMN-containing dehydrogenase
MENLGDTNAQALAGAISTSTHGSGLRLGSLSSQVVGLNLITASGELAFSVIGRSVMSEPLSQAGGRGERAGLDLERACSPVSLLGR